MKLPQRVVRLLLSSMMFLSLAIRFPFSNHELGVDSFFIHNLATNIAKDGNAEWVLSPLSLFGWYPMSYPSGGPFLIATSAFLVDMPIETTILLLSMGFGAVGVLTAFVMAHEFRDDDLFCITVSFVYAFAPRFLDFTLWSASMRGLFVVLLPMFVWSTLRASREPKLKNFALVLGLFLVMASIHRMAALLAAMLGALVGAMMVGVTFRILRLNLPRLLLSNTFRRLSGLLILMGFTGIGATILFGTSVLGEYSQGELLSGKSIEIELFNLGISLARSVGLGLALATLGFLVLVRSRNKTLRESYVVLVFLALIPTLFLRQYTGFYILPFVAILGGLALAGLMRLRSPKIRRVVFAAFLVSILAFSAGVLRYEIDHSTTVPDATYSTALYLRNGCGGDRVIANDGLLAVRVASIAACPVLPIGGAGVTSQGPELLAYHYFTSDEVSRNIGRLPLQDLTLESDSPWVAYGIDAQTDWVRIMQSPYDNPTSTLARYRPNLYLENRDVELNLYSFGHTFPSAFAGSAHDEAYLIYESPVESVYYVYSP